MQFEAMSMVPTEVGPGEKCFLGTLLDEELIKAEFEAMIAQEFPTATRVSGWQAPPSSGTYLPAGIRCPALRDQAAATAAGPWKLAGRQRSPPKSVDSRTTG